MVNAQAVDEVIRKTFGPEPGMGIAGKIALVLPEPVDAPTPGADPDIPLCIFSKGFYIIVGKTVESFGSLRKMINW